MIFSKVSLEYFSEISLWKIKIECNILNHNFIDLQSESLFDENDIRHYYIWLVRDNSVGMGFRCKDTEHDTMN